MLNGDHVALTRGIMTVVNERIEEVVRNHRPGAQTIQFPAPTVTVTNEVGVPSVTNEISVPPSHVTNNLPELSVNVDMGPVAQAFVTMAAALDRQAAQLARLIDVLAEQKAPSVHPEITVEAPNITVQPAPMPPAPKSRSIVIKHSDGTRSTVTEE